MGRLLSNKLSLLDRYIIAEIISPFLFGVGIFSSLGITAGILIDLINKITENSLSLALALQVLLLKIPEFVCYSLPISTLLAALMAYGRLSNDSEIIALRSSGISVYRLVVPVLSLSLFITAITFVFNELIVPASNYQATHILETHLPKDEDYVPRDYVLYPEYQEFKRPNGEVGIKLKNLFYADQFDGQKLNNLTVLSWNQERLKQIVVSQTAEWNQQKNLWNFFNGIICAIEDDQSYGQVKLFKNQEFSWSKVPMDLAKKYRDPQNMNLKEIQEYLTILQLSNDSKNIVKYQVQFYKKIFFPFVCVVFALAGSALGIRPQYTGKGTSFGICVAIIFNYYLVSFMIEAFGSIGILTPLISGILPNLLGLGIAFFLLIKAEKM